MIDTRYALLDTDFISKTHLIQKDNQNKLIDKILSMPNYKFYCHKQICIELKRHDITEVAEWLESMVHSQSILMYDDEMILDELITIYGDSAYRAYIEMLKTACDSYEYEYFENNFSFISNLNNFHINKTDFLMLLQAECKKIDEGQNLGELKSYVLLQALHVMLGEQIYVFCSDDKNARNGIINIGGARCISVLSSFVRLKKEINFTKEEAMPYIDSYLNHCLGKEQKTFKIQDTSKEKRMCKIPCAQVFDDIFEDKIEDLKNGNLKYLS